MKRDMDLVRLILFGGHRLKPRPRGTSPSKFDTLADLVALCSAVLNRPAVLTLAILGNLSIGGTLLKWKS
jgi:predicted ATP-dependent Lon-type protease